MAVGDAIRPCTRDELEVQVKHVIELGITILAMLAEGTCNSDDLLDAVEEMEDAMSTALGLCPDPIEGEEDDS